MGVNYYVCRKLSNDDKKKANELLENDKYAELIDFINDKSFKIHIGKQSCGWQFLFNHNDFKYYELNRNDIYNFLLKHEIVNEYGEIISNDDFWKMVDNNIDKLNNKQYYEKEPMLPFMILDEIIPMNLRKYNVELYEFYSDGLRFSSSTEFS